MKEQEIYEKAIKLWGKQFQTDMMIEEASELIKAILKERRGKSSQFDIISEIVDCQIMINQMRIIYDNDVLYNSIMRQKIERLSKMIEREV